MTAKSVFNSKSRKQFHTINRPCWVTVSMGKGQVKEMCLQVFLKGSNWNGWTDRQREAVPKRCGTRVKSSCTSVGLDPRDWQIIIVVWSQWTGKNRCGMNGLEINRLFFTQAFAGQQIDLKKSILNLTNQWRERSSGRLRVKGGDFVTMRASWFCTRWSLVRQYHTKLNCNNWDDWTREQLQVIVHYPDQGVSESINQSINQSINKTSIAPISPVKPGSVARQPNQYSTTKSRKQFRNINATDPAYGKSMSYRLLIYLSGR